MAPIIGNLTVRAVADQLRAAAEKHFAIATAAQEASKALQATPRPLEPVSGQGGALSGPRA